MNVKLIRPETVNTVLVKMFGQTEKTESTLLGGISIIQTLLMATKFKLVSLLLQINSKNYTNLLFSSEVKILMKYIIKNNHWPKFCILQFYRF